MQEARALESETRLIPDRRRWGSAVSHCITDYDLVWNVANESSESFRADNKNTNYRWWWGL